MGAGGLAFFVRAGDQLGVFVRTDAGDMVEVLQERYTNVYRVPRLAWQPAAADPRDLRRRRAETGAVLRVFDMSTGDLQALSMFPVGYAACSGRPTAPRSAS